MKTFGTIMKIVAALAVIAGIVYVVATYGDKIVAWAKKILDRFSCGCACDECTCVCEGDCDECACEGDCENDCPCEAAAAAAEAVEEAPVEEAPAEEAPVEGTVVAEDGDFAG